jgi:hypothetical protein
MERTMRFCTLCSHQLRQQIDELLLQNTSFRDIAERFYLSLGAISRHRSHCLAAALQSRKTESTETVLSRVERLQQRTEKILDAAERDDDRMIALASIREARRNYELLAKLTGELDAQSIPVEAGKLQINIIRVEATPLPKPAGPVIEALPIAENKPN